MNKEKTILPPHWNEYADSSTSMYWERDLSKEWIEI